MECMFLLYLTFCECCPCCVFADGNPCLRRSGTDMIPKARMKTLKMTIVIVSSFVICWTPYYLLGVWYWFQPAMIRHTPEYVHHILFVFGNLNTCCDPVIYGFYTPSFRADLADVMACCRGHRANNASPRSVDRLSARCAGAAVEMESDLSSNQHSGNPGWAVVIQPWGLKHGCKKHSVLNAAVSCSMHKEIHTSLGGVQLLFFLPCWTTIWAVRQFSHSSHLTTQALIAPWMTSLLSDPIISGQL